MSRYTNLFEVGWPDAPHRAIHLTDGQDSYRVAQATAGKG